MVPLPVRGRPPPGRLRPGRIGSPHGHSHAHSRRILVAGSAGAQGKTTLCREIARRSGIPHTEIDALFHGPGSSPAPSRRGRAAPGVPAVVGHGVAVRRRPPPFSPSAPTPSCGSTSPSGR
ncbi:hypothetical protein QJS66_12400 [Kocuria rhizophila]|nr:hypothetical protein QJS66_12400 [Kocuria rhizophila]